MLSRAKANRAQSSHPKDSGKATQMTSGNPQLLGEGVYGQVFLTKDGYAIKKTNNGGYDFLASPAEIDITLFLQGSPYVVEVKHCQWNNFHDQSSRTQDDVFLVMEVGTDAHSWITEHYDDYSRERYMNAKKIILDMFCGLLQLKHSRIIHRDIKPSNLLIVKTSSNSDDPSIRVKLIDFGFATFVTNYRECSGVSAIDYRAPECFACHYYEVPMDMWSAGLTAYELLLGFSIYDIDRERSRDYQIESLIEGCIDNQAEAVIRDYFRADQLAKYNPDQGKIRSLIRTYYKSEVVSESELDDFMDLLTKCLRFHPDLRLTPEQAIEHRWFSDCRPDNIEILGVTREELPYQVNKQVSQLRRSVLNPFIKIINTWLAKKSVDVCYNLRDLTHAIRMFDVCLLAYHDQTVPKQLAHDLIYLCIYTAFKYFHPLDKSFQFKQLYKSPTPHKELVIIQRKIIVDYLKQVIFSPTIYEACCGSDHELNRVAYARGITLIIKGETGGQLPSQLITANASSN